jgi:hypothetical protein
VISRLGVVLLFMTGLLFAYGAFTGYGFRAPLEAAVRAELMTVATPEKLDGLILAAIARDDMPEALMYLEIADYLGVGVPATTQAKLDETLSLGSAIARNTREFGSAFLTGEGESTAGVVGALTSDFTVIGDVRDIGAEGGRMLAGAPYSQVMLGLSVIGLTAADANAASGDGRAVVKAGVSILKIANRGGKLTAEFATGLTLMLERAVDFAMLKETLRTTKLTDFKATEDAMAAYAHAVSQAELFPVLATLNDVQDAAGPTETIRMLKYVKTAGNLADVAAIAARYGEKSRGIMELTGKTSLRGFKTAYSMAEMAMANIWGWGAWIGALLAMSLMRGRRRSSLRARKRRVFTPVSKFGTA